MIVVDDYLAYAARKDSIDAWVRGGGRLVFLELPTGRYQIADDTVEVLSLIHIYPSILL